MTDPGGENYSKPDYGITGPVSPPPPAEPEGSGGFLDRRVGGRPLIVYLALAAGMAVLGLLLVVVWMSATNGGETQQPPCLDITPIEAEQAILAGEVEQVDVLVDKTDPVDSLTLIQAKMTDGSCRKLPEGADNRDALYMVLGVVTHVNETSDQHVRINYITQEVPGNLLATSTATPTQTAVPTESPLPSATPEASLTAAPSATRVPPTATRVPPTVAPTHTAVPPTPAPPTATP